MRLNKLAKPIRKRIGQHYDYLLECDGKLCFGDFADCFGNTNIAFAIYEQYMINDRILKETNDKSAINDFNILEGDVINPVVGNKYYVVQVALTGSEIHGDRWAVGTLDTINSSATGAEYELSLLFNTTETFVERMQGVIHTKPLFFSTKAKAEQEVLFLNLKNGNEIGELIEANLREDTTLNITELVSLHKMDSVHFIKQLRIGIKVEQGHTLDLKLAKELAINNLKENSCYYTKGI